MSPVPSTSQLRGFAGCAFLFLLGTNLAQPSTAEPPKRTAFVHARVFPVAQAPIDDGVVIVAGAHIVFVGSFEDAEIADGDQLHDLSGKVMIPGLVDSHSHLGRVSGGDQSHPLHPGVRALDAIDIHDPGFVRGLAGGITTANVMPGSGHLMSGQTVYLKLRRLGTRIEDWLFCDDTQNAVCGGMKMANGTNSMRQPPFPGTRAKSAALARQLFIDAEQYRSKLGSDSPPDRDLGLEAITQILDGKRIVHFHTHRHDDIATLLRLSDEFGFRPVIQHGSESWQLAEEIAERNLVVSMTLVDSPGGKEEILGYRFDAPAILRKAGVRVALNTDDWIDDSRWFLRVGALAIRFGLSEADALAALTRVPAEAMGLDHRLGTLETNKDADLVILSGHPFSVYSHVEQTWVEGRKVFDREDPDDAAIAIGGYGILQPRSAHVH